MRARRWKKLLYEQQDYPDNYVDDEHFLKYDVVKYDSRYDTVVSFMMQATVPALQIVIATIFLVIYKSVVELEHQTQVHVLFVLNLIIYGSIGMGDVLIGGNAVRKGVTWRAMVSFLVTLRIVSPVLQSLTSSYSSDTIHAMAIVLSAIHLIFFDYNYIFEGNSIRTSPLASSPAPPYRGALSLNAAMLTAVLLASRMYGLTVVFPFLMLAVAMFTFLPLLVRQLYLWSPRLHWVLCVLLSLLTSMALTQLDRVLFYVFVGILFFVWIVCPALLYLLLRRWTPSFVMGPWIMPCTSSLAS